MKRNIVWNLTGYCPWNCKFCCINTLPVKGFVQRTNDTKHLFTSNEFSFDEKIYVIEQLKPGDFTIDFSGGELLVDLQNIDVIEFASKKLGKENIGISIYGIFINDNIITRLSQSINDVEVTLDKIPYEIYKNRPVGYHEFAFEAVKKFVKAGVYVGIQTVLTKDNICEDNLYKLLEILTKYNMNEWGLLRFFPSGRGAAFGEEITPTEQEYHDAVEYIKKISHNKNILVKFQYLLPNHDLSTRKCRAVKKSIGILADGKITACFWALDNIVKKDNYLVLLK